MHNLRLRADLRQVLKNHGRTNLIISLEEGAPTLESIAEADKMQRTEFNSTHRVEVEPSSFFIHDIGNMELTFFGLLFPGPRIHTFNAACTNWHITAILAIPCVAGILLNTTIMLGFAPRWMSWLCLLGLGTPIYVVLWFDRALFWHTFYTVDALVPLILNTIYFVLFCVMVDGDVRVICGLQKYLLILMVIFDDAGTHNNEPWVARKIERDIRLRKENGGKGLALAAAGGPKMAMVVGMTTGGVRITSRPLDNYAH